MTILAESSEGLIFVERIRNDIIIKDQYIGIIVTLSCPGGCCPDKIEIKQDKDYVNARVVLQFGTEDVIYGGGFLQVPATFPVEIFFDPIAFIFPLLIREKPVLDGSIAPCECKVVVQKRDGFIVFRRPVRRSVGNLTLFYFGWYGEEIKTITYCNFGEIEKTVDLQTHFHPELPRFLRVSAEIGISHFAPFKVDP